MSSKGKAINDALTQAGVVVPKHSDTTNKKLIPVKDNTLLSGWARHPGNNPYKLSLQCLTKLKEMYDIGKSNNKWKVSAERAHEILLSTILVDCWDQKLILTVPKIKAFFGLSPKKIDETLESCQIDSDLVEMASWTYIEIERALNATDIMDTEMD